MGGTVGETGGRVAAAVAAGLAGLLAAGCSTSGRGITFFPEEHRMLDTAKALRQPPAATLGLPRELQKQPLPPYTVEPGDVLLVQPADLDSPVRLPGDQPVLLDGTISLGRYGLLQVAGKTLPEIEDLVRTAVQAQLKEARDGKDAKDVRDPGPITVRVVSRQSKVYYVLGEVNAPGSFPLNGREAVLDGILAAGGLTDRASRTNIILSRPTLPDHCRIVLPVCYQQIVQLGDTTTNYQLAPGDRIYVATRTCLESLLGERHKKDCLCDGPQVPCTLADHGHTASTGPPPAALPAPAGTEALPPPAVLGSPSAMRPQH
jgi:protein involved in polysaccharide export with SLBB domain